jgi:hypothetical protein
VRSQALPKVAVVVALSWGDPCGDYAGDETGSESDWNLGWAVNVSEKVQVGPVKRVLLDAG